MQRLAGAREIAATTLNIPHPYQDGMAEQWIRTHRPAFENGTSANFAVVTRREATLCGAIGLRINPQDQNGELGYWIGVPYWGQGFCTEAAAKIVEYGFRGLNLHRIHAAHLRHNSASGRVMRKIGMVHEGRLRQHVCKWGVFEDLEKYGLLASEWHEPSIPDPYFDVEYR